jgi:ferric-dicitrate binding protein FerR (iron transport regulator)
VPAGQSLFISGSTLRPATTDERDAADAWRNGTLAVTNRPLREVLPQLRRWYGLDIHAEQPAFLERPVSFRASLDSSRQAIRGVEQSTGLEFGYMGPNMVFRTPAAKKAGKK